MDSHEIARNQFLQQEYLRLFFVVGDKDELRSFLLSEQKRLRALGYYPPKPIPFRPPIKINRSLARQHNRNVRIRNS